MMQDPQTTDVSTPELPRIAIVVIGRNEGERLRRCLTSIQSMHYPHEQMEIIYVDSSSTDESVALAQSLGVRTIVLEGPTTAARGRNAGWTQTHAPIILFLDGDTLLDPEFVAANLQHFNDATVAGVWGNRREMRTGDSTYNAIFDLDWNVQPGWTLFFGGDALVRREALAAVNGYNERLIAGEEPDMCRRIRELGYRILHVDEPMTLHDLGMHHFSQYWQRSKRTGYAYAEVSAKYARTNDPLWSAESRQNVKRGLFWIAGPLLCLMASLLLRSWIPIALFVLVAALLFLRTAMKTRRLTSSTRLVAAYSLHSHFQQVPIFLGQLRFWRMRLFRRRSAIMEYKATP